MPNFPEPTDDQLIAFIYHTIRLDRVPMDRTTIERTIHSPEVENHDPYVAGQYKSIMLISSIAEDDIFPKVNNVFELDTKIPWVKRLHRNMMKPVAEFGALVLDGNLINHSQLGQFRQSVQRTESPFGTIEAPSQFHIRDLLLEWTNDIHEFEQKHLHIIRGVVIDNETAELFVEKAEEMSLRFAAIKPFEDGNNSAARLLENLIRLHWGLPWKIVPEQTREDYAEKLRDVMKTYEGR